VREILELWLVESVTDIYFFKKGACDLFHLFFFFFFFFFFRWVVVLFLNSISFKHHARSVRGIHDRESTPRNGVGVSGGGRGGHDLDVPLNVVIPMGGLFKHGHSVVPPPLRNIVGRPIIFWLLDHLTLGPHDTVWIGLPKEVDEYFALSKQVRHGVPIGT